MVREFKSHSNGFNSGSTCGLIGIEAEIRCSDREPEKGRSYKIDTRQKA